MYVMWYKIIILCYARFNDIVYVSVALRTVYIYRADDRVPGCGRVSARTRDSVLGVYSGMESKRVQLFGECAECDG